MIKREIKEKIIKNAISLKRYGINNLAWSKENGQKLIHEIENDNIGVLGGDIYKLTLNLEPLPDNWSCEPNGLESEEEFYVRSKAESLKYITDYPVKSGEKILFSIIFTEQIWFIRENNVLTSW